MSQQDQGRRDFKLAFFWTGGIIVALSIASSGFGYATVSPDPHLEFPPAMAVLWLLGLGTAVAALIAAAVMSSKGRRSLASGIGGGLGVGVLALGVSCFANFRIGGWAG